MSDAGQFEVDTSGLQTMMADLRHALTSTGNGDGTEIVRDETKRLIRQIVRFTPPQTQRQGNFAIQRELRSLFSEAKRSTIDEVGSAHGITGVDAYLSARDGSPIHLKWQLIDVDGSRMKEFHNRAKNKRGKVPLRKRSSNPGEWAARVIVPIGKREPFIKKEMSKVGRWKAAWCKLAVSLGLKVQPYVSRHAGSPFAVGDDSGMTNGIFPHLIFGSRAPGTNAQLHHIQDAVRVRAEAIRRRVKLILSGYAKEHARGMKISAMAKRMENNQARPWNEYGDSGISG